MYGLFRLCVSYRVDHARIGFPDVRVTSPLVPPVGGGRRGARGRARLYAEILPPAPDNDVTGVLTQKNVFPDWKVENWHVYPDPRARYADLSNPDRPTFPPDDFAAYRLSPNPQQPRKHVGVGRVDGEGYVKYLSAWDCDNRAQATARGDGDERDAERSAARGPGGSPARSQRQTRSAADAHPGAQADGTGHSAAGPDEAAAATG